MVTAEYLSRNKKQAEQLARFLRRQSSPAHLPQSTLYKPGQPGPRKKTKFLNILERALLLQYYVLTN